MVIKNVPNLTEGTEILSYTIQPLLLLLLLEMSTVTIKYVIV